MSRYTSTPAYLYFEYVRVNVKNIIEELYKQKQSTCKAILIFKNI